jgi:hypothetical protein
MYSFLVMVKITYRIGVNKNVQGVTLNRMPFWRGIIRAEGAKTQNMSVLIWQGAERQLVIKEGHFFLGGKR